MSGRFVSSDVWLSDTLGRFKDLGATLLELVLTGDKINQPVFIKNELGGGYAKESNGRFAVAGDLSNFVQAHKDRPLPEVLESAHGFLEVERSTSIDPRETDEPAELDSLSDSAFEAIYREWRAASSQAIAAVLGYVASRSQEQP